MSEQLDPINDALWLYGVLPIVVLTALLIAFQTRGAPFTKIAQAFKGLRETDAEADGETTAMAPLFVSAALAIGAASTIGAATAVSLAGPGVLFWIWVAAILVAGLRYGETMLARTDAPGRSDASASGSLTRRLLRGGGGVRGLGFALLLLLAVTGFAFIGGVQGAAVLEAGSAVLPGSAPVTGYAVAGGAAALALLGLRRGGAMAAWLAIAALLALLVAALLSIAGDPGRAFGALARGVTEAFSGAPAASPWVGASATEVFLAALLFGIPPMLAGTGIAGALHGAARAKATRRQAAVSILEPIVYALVATVLVMAFVGAGSYFRRVQTERPMSEVAVYTSGFETRAQRDEADRLKTGYLRVVDGVQRDRSLEFATHQGTIREARFEFRGAPADVALHLAGGHPLRMLRPKDGALGEVDLSELDDLVVTGEMLPRGGALFSDAMSRGSDSDLAGRLAFIAILLLLVVGAGAFGLGLSRSLPPAAPAWARAAIGIVPAAGIAAASVGVVPAFGVIGTIAAAASAIVAAIAIALLAKQTR